MDQHVVDCAVLGADVDGGLQGAAGARVVGGHAGEVAAKAAVDADSGVKAGEGRGGAGVDGDDVAVAGELVPEAAAGGGEAGADRGGLGRGGAGVGGDGLADGDVDGVGAGGVGRGLSGRAGAAGALAGVAAVGAALKGAFALAEDEAAVIGAARAQGRGDDGEIDGAGGGAGFGGGFADGDGHLIGAAGGAESDDAGEGEHAWRRFGEGDGLGAWVAEGGEVGGDGVSGAQRATARGDVDGDGVCAGAIVDERGRRDGGGARGGHRDGVDTDVEPHESDVVGGGAREGARGGARVGGDADGVGGDGGDAAVDDGVGEVDDAAGAVGVVGGAGEVVAGVEDAPGDEVGAIDEGAGEALGVGVVVHRARDGVEVGVVEEEVGVGARAGGGAFADGDRAVDDRAGDGLGRHGIDGERADVVGGGDAGARDLDEELFLLAEAVPLDGASAGDEGGRVGLEAGIGADVDDAGGLGEAADGDGVARREGREGEAVAVDAKGPGAGLDQEVVGGGGPIGAHRAGGVAADGVAGVHARAAAVAEGRGGLGVVGFNLWIADGGAGADEQHGERRRGGQNKSG